MGLKMSLHEKKKKINEEEEAQGHGQAKTVA